MAQEFRPHSLALRHRPQFEFTYKSQSVDVKQVGRESGVRYVLEGSVRKAGNRVRITAQLIEAFSGAHLWADRFDGSLEDVFELQDKVAISVAGVIEPTWAWKAGNLRVLGLHLHLWSISPRQLPASTEDPTRPHAGKAEGH
jgi:hypothetical protein